MTYTLSVGLGPTNHVESFTQSPDYAQGRALRDWFVECADEPCRMEVDDAVARKKGMQVR
jgi:hypothetical protein